MMEKPVEQRLDVRVKIHFISLKALITGDIIFPLQMKLQPLYQEMDLRMSLIKEISFLDFKEEV